MEASICNQFSHPLGDEISFSTTSYRKLLSAYGELPFVTVERVSSIRSPDLGEIPLPFVRYSPPTRSSSRRLKVVITAGIHGDEPAGVYGLYRALLSISLRQIPVEIFAFPCVNPTGLLRNSRASSGHFDLNRQMTRHSIAPEVRAMLSTLERLETTFDAAFDLHEDLSIPKEESSTALGAPGFYLYESNFDPRRPSIGGEISRAVARAGIAVSSQRTIHGERARNGVIQRGLERSQVSDFERFITMNYTDQVVTFLTNPSLCAQDRVRAHSIALESGIATLRDGRR